MAARVDSVAKFVCEKGNWQVTNLQLQKILYITQMVYMGRNEGSLLFEGRFEAWDYGPVEPSVYRRVRMFGAKPVQDVFYHAGYFQNNDSRRALLEEVCNELLPKKPGDLVDLTHWSEGAWAKHYVPGIRGITIPDEDIHAEYLKRKAG
jgi:uncharacterized phage-associated protein